MRLNYVATAASARNEKFHPRFSWNFSLIKILIYSTKIYIAFASLGGIGNHLSFHQTPRNNCCASLLGCVCIFE
jgi:hypothetical protein